MTARVPLTHTVTLIAGSALLLGRSPSRAAGLPSGVIVTVAGSATAPDPVHPGRLRAGFGGDEGPALAALLAAPGGIAIDLDGTLYIADTGNGRVRKARPGGAIFTYARVPAQGLALDVAGDLVIARADTNRLDVADSSGATGPFAGSGPAGFTGDGGTADKARFDDVAATVIDGLRGKTYVADRRNHRIRSVGPYDIVATVAGSGPADDPSTAARPDAGPVLGGFAGDSGPATLAHLDSPSAVTVDASGNLFIADTGNHRIRKVTLGGIVTTVAGSGATGPDGGGFAGDGGPATSARLSSPAGVAVDAAGDLFIADTGNHRIREVGADGVIRTVAGGGPAAPNDPVGAPPGSAAGFTGDGGPATSARLNEPTGIALDALGNLFIADTGNQRVREVAGSAARGLIAGGPFPPAPLTIELTVDGMTRTALVYPGDRARDVASPLVFGFDGAGGSGAGMSATLLHQAWPDATVVYPDEEPIQNPAGGSVPGWQLAPGDLDDRDVRFVDALIDEASARLRIDPNRIYAAGFSYGAVFTYVLMRARPERFAAFAPVDGCVEHFMKWATVPRPVLIATNSRGCGADPLYSDRQVTWARRVDGAGPATQPWDEGYDEYAAAPDGQPVVRRANVGPHFWPFGATPKVVRFFQEHTLDREPPASIRAGIAAPDPTRVAAGTGAAGSLVSLAGMLGRLDEPEGIAIDRDGRLLIADTLHSRVRQATPDGTLTTIAGSGLWDFPARPSQEASEPQFARLTFPEGVASDASGRVYIADTFNGRIRRIDPGGVMATVAGSGVDGFGGDGGTATDARLLAPSSIALDSSGDLYIADTGNQRIRRVDPRGVITTIAGTGAAGYGGDGGLAVAALLQEPEGIAVDGIGDVYFADSYNHRVRRIDRTGILRTVAGTGLAGFAGDGGPATAAQLNVPSGVAVDAAGSIFVADTFNGRVRKIASDGTITTVAGGEGPAGTATPLDRPVGLAIDANGTLFIADTTGQRVWRVPGAAAPGLLAGTAFARVPGDVDRDGRVTIHDAILALAAAVGLSADLNEIRLADANGDGKVNLRDVTLILRIALGL